MLGSSPSRLPFRYTKQLVAALAVLSLVVAAVDGLAHDAGDLDRLEQFQQSWRDQLARYLEASHIDERQTVWEVLNDAVGKNYIDASFLRMLGSSNSLLQEDMSTFATGRDVLTQPVDAGGCAAYNGEDCNGEKHGVCEDSKCVCRGGWTGKACHIPPELANYDPMTGTSEPNRECAGYLDAYKSQC